MPYRLKSLASITTGVFLTFGWLQILVGSWGYLSNQPTGMAPFPFNTWGAWPIWVTGVTFFLMGLAATRLRRML